MTVAIKSRICFIILFLPLFLRAQEIKIVTNHVGYENSHEKKRLW